MSKKIMCLGSCGFILSNFVRKVIKDKLGYEIASIDKVDSSNQIHNIYGNKNHNFYIGNVLDKHFINIVFDIEKPDVVIYGADSEVNCLENNILGINNILNICDKYKSKLLYLSTDEVYGYLSEDSEESFQESSMVYPTNDYLISKISSESLVLNHGHQVLRISKNTAGPRQMFSRNLIPKTIVNLLDQNLSEIICDDHKFDWTHVDDVTTAIIQILENGQDKIYNVTSEHDYLDVDVIKHIMTIVGVDKKIIFSDKLFKKLSSNNIKLRSLGWKPSQKMQTWLPVVCQWYINNQWFLKYD